MIRIILNNPVAKQICFFFFLALFPLLLLNSCSNEQETFDSAQLDVSKTADIPLIVSLVKPEGVEQKDVNQVVIIFNKKMVPLGDMEKSAQELSVRITPSPGCHWRWLNTNSLACWLDNPLANSSEYKITIGAGIKALDGTVLASDYKTTFSTQTIKLVRQDVEFNGPVNPAITAAFNQPVTIDSLQKSSALSCDGGTIESEISIRQLKIEEEEGNWDASRSYRFEPKVDLPADARCYLTLSKEMRSTEGALSPIKEVSIAFSTYPDFYVTKFSCGWRNDEEGSETSGMLELKDCNPGNSIGLQFSVPTFNKHFSGKLSITPKAGWRPGGYNSPEYMRDNPEETLQHYYLNSPFDGTTTYDIVLSDELTDRFGRKLKGSHQFKFTTGHYKPSLDITKKTAVIEKEGPHQLGFRSVNIKNFRLRLFASSNADDLDYIRLSQDYRSACKADQVDPKNLYTSQTISLNQPWDVYMVQPLDFKKLLPKHDHGFVLGLIDQIYDLENNRVDIWSHNNRPKCPQVFYVQVTDLGITSKLGYFNGGTWVNSLREGKPRSGVTVDLINGDNAILFSGKTDNSGFVEIPGLKNLDPERKVNNWREDDWYLVAHTQDDMSLLVPDEWGRGIYPSSFNIATTRLTAKNNFLIQTITDRPLYKRGDEVRIKLFARQWDHKALKLLDPDERELFVDVVNYRNDKVLEHKVVTLNDFSTGQLSFKLPKNASTGPYSIRVTNSHDYTLASSDVFRIEEYRLPDFKIKLASDKGAYDKAEFIPINGHVEYHFGGSVNNVEGRLNASFKSGAYRPSSPKLTDYSFGEAPIRENWWDIREPENRAMRFLQKNIATDDQGTFKDLVNLPKTLTNSYGHISLEAGFKDDNGKTIANRINVEIHPADYYVGLKLSEWVYAPGEDLGVNTIALSPEEKLLSGKKVKLTLLHRTYHTVRRRGVGNFFNYETVTKDEPVKECELTTASKARSCKLVPDSAGFYIVRAESKDRRGRHVVSSLSTYVTGPDYIGWWRHDHDRIDLIPEKTAYKLGDTLRVLVKSPYDRARALITIERHGILYREERELVGGAQVIELPLKNEAYAPGVYLSVVLVQGRVGDKIENNVDLGKPSFKMGMVSVPVENAGTRLQVTTRTRNPQYKPGDNVTTELSVKDIKGRGTESEIAVAVVDEALLQLVANYQQKYEVHDGFYHMPKLDMMTGETLIHLLGRRHYGKKGVAAGGGGGDSKITLREAFKAVAHWEPSVLTDANGKATINFKAPDNLTSWRIIAVAVDRHQRFGTGGSSFKVNKELMLVSALPNFATEGDEFDARFVVHNRASSDLEVDVALKADGLELQSKPKQTIQVKKDNKNIVQFPVKAQTIDSATLEITADGGVDTDGMRLQLPISKFVSFETFATYGTTTSGQVKEQLDIPQGIRTDVGGVDLLLSSSVLSHLDDTIRYTTNYPYQCWEQRLTRALTVRNTLELDNYLGDDVRVTAEEAKKQINVVLENAPLFQSSNGGFAYWKAQNELASPYLSAYTALGYHWLQQSGYDVDQAVSTKLHDYLRGLLASDSSWPWWYTDRSKATVRAMIAYVLGKYGEDVSGDLSTLYKERELLSLFGQGFLVMALHQAGSDMQTQQEKVQKEIMGLSEITSGKVQFSESIDDGFQRILHSTTRSNCLMLTAFTEIDPGGQLVTPLMRSIADSRRANRWNNTQENLYCLNAMRDYAKIYETEVPNFVVKGTLGDHELGEIKFDSMQAKPTILSYKFAEKDPGTESVLKMEKDGPGRVYYTARIRLAYQEPRLDEVNAGMTVSRHYYLQKDNQWVPLTDNANIQRGDLVRVQLKVAIPRERIFVALNDPLPAGLEPINTALATASTADAAGESNNSAGAYVWDEDEFWYGAYRTGGFYHRELRLQAVQYFADFISPGEYELNYVTQAIATGKFSASPTLIEEMYNPETYGKSKPAHFVISEKKNEEE